MIPIIAIENIQNLITKVKDHKKGYLTNFFLDIPKLELWIRLSLIEFEDYDETVIIWKKNRGFKNLYFITTSLDVLKEGIICFLSKHKDELCVIDIVAKGTNISEFLNVLTNCGFYQYASLVRMSKIINAPSKKELNTSNLHVADRLKGIEVHKLLQIYFDAFAEQLPLLEEISAWAEKKRIIIYSDNVKIVQGFLVFELIGQTSYLRYWFVHPDHRDKKIGSTLLNYFFAQSIGTKRQIFWVMESNTNAIKRYEHFDFKKENLFDYVMINKDIIYEKGNS